MSTLGASPSGGTPPKKERGTLNKFGNVIKRSFSSDANPGRKRSDTSDENSLAKLMELNSNSGSYSLSGSGGSFLQQNNNNNNSSNSNNNGTSNSNNYSIANLETKNPRELIDIILKLDSELREARRKLEEESRRKNSQ